MTARVRATLLIFLTITCAPRLASEARAATSATATLPVACGAGIVHLPVTWYFPDAQSPAGLVWLQHGFFRTKENVRDLASRVARAGFLVVTPTIASLQPACTFNDVTGFLPNLARVFGKLEGADSPLLTSAATAGSRVGIAVGALPTRFVFAGHSAGGSAVATVAKEFVTRFPSRAGRLRGLILFDPVENLAGSMRASLPSLWNVPIFTISARPNECNADISGTQALLGLGRSFIGFEVTTGSHCDAEGTSGNPVLCGLICGRVLPSNVFVLQVFALGWTADLLLGRVTPTLYPGGPFYDALTGSGVIRTY